MTGEELSKIKKAYVDKMESEARDGVVTMDVHMGTCGIAAGGLKIFEALQKEIERLETKNVNIRNTGCAGFCSMEPMMTVHVPGQSSVKYGHLDAKKALEIFYSHVLGGQAKADYAIGHGLEKPQQRVKGR
jgi:NADP-reducing hydrogenase subunit HndB